MWESDWFELKSFEKGPTSMAINHRSIEREGAQRKS